MQETLVGAGLACIIAAIVGGGLKAFNLELPGIASVTRQVLLGTFGVVVLVLGLMNPFASGPTAEEDPEPPAEPEEIASPDPEPPPSPEPDGASDGPPVFEVALGT